MYAFYIRLCMHAAKSLQLCPTLCDLIDRSPPGPLLPGILQVRTLEWVAISFFNMYICICMCVCIYIHTHIYIYTNMYTVLEKAMATHSSALAWKIPWMEEPGRLQSMGLLRVGHY